MTEEKTHIHFEDTEDMMDHVHEKIEDAIYYYCLCTKMMMYDADPKIVRSLLIQLVADEYDDINKKLVPYVEANSDGIKFYGLIQRD